MLFRGCLGVPNHKRAYKEIKITEAKGRMELKEERKKRVTN